MFIWCNRKSSIQRVSAGVCDELSPAEYCLFEWREYFVRCESADRLLVGEQEAQHVGDGVFIVEFANQLGLARLRAFDGDTLISQMWVEVLSSKFPEPRRHLSFFEGLLDDLFARAARLPFTVSEQTARGVTEALRPPTPIFALHFLSHYGRNIQGALGIVQTSSHRELMDRPERIPLWQAREADADVLLDMLQAEGQMVRTSAVPVARRMNGQIPERVAQRLPIESFDTAENRFVRHFVTDLLRAADALEAQGWWERVADERRARIKETTGVLRDVLRHAPLEDAGEMHRFPGSSQVLIRREGYRDMRRLWQQFQIARRPLFEQWQQAIDLRDIATLYEIWVFFALADRIRRITETDPVLEIELSDRSGLGWKSQADFGDAGTLYYNKSWRGYSGGFRPDYTWEPSTGPRVVLDAKFRLNRRDFRAADDDEDTPEAVAKRADLYKMHTYRDALKDHNVRAAVALYPGTVPEFYDAQIGCKRWITLRRLLQDESITGIGAIPFSPSKGSEELSNG